MGVIKQHLIDKQNFVSPQVAEMIVMSLLQHVKKSHLVFRHETLEDMEGIGMPTTVLAKLHDCNYKGYIIVKTNKNESVLSFHRPIDCHCCYMEHGYDGFGIEYYERKEGKGMCTKLWCLCNF